MLLITKILVRELYGRGLIGWAKASTWYQSLQAAQNRVAAESAAPQAPGSPDSRLRIQIELLSGQVLLMEARFCHDLICSMIYYYDVYNLFS